MRTRFLPRAAAALALAALLTGCTATVPEATVRPPAGFVVPTELPNGRVEITISPLYRIGTMISVPVAIVATRGTITGPLSARVLASGINEAGAPAEALVRDLAVTPITVSGGRRSVTLTWDTRDTKGLLVPADAYALVLLLRVEDGGTATERTAAVTLELR